MNSPKLVYGFLLFFFSSIHGHRFEETKFSENYRLTNDIRTDLEQMRTQDESHHREVREHITNTGKNVMGRIDASTTELTNTIVLTGTKINANLKQIGDSLGQMNNKELEKLGEILDLLKSEKTVDDFIKGKLNEILGALSKDDQGLANLKTDLTNLVAALAPTIKQVEEMHHKIMEIGKHTEDHKNGLDDLANRMNGVDLSVQGLKMTTASEVRAITNKHDTTALKETVDNMELMVRRMERKLAELSFPSNDNHTPERVNLYLNQ